MFYIFDKGSKIQQIKDYKPQSCQSYLEADLAKQLLIVRNYNTSLTILSVITELEDNIYAIGDKQSIKKLDCSTQNLKQSSICETLNFVCQQTQFCPLPQELCDKLTILNHIHTLQFNQSIKNTLMFQALENKFQNEMFQTILLYSLYFQKKTRQQNQRYLFINLSGLNTIEQDFDMMKNINLLKKNHKDVFCISIHKKNKQDDLKKNHNYGSCFEQYFLENEKNNPINWFQLKFYIKHIMKRKIQQFHPHLVILQLYFSFDQIQNCEGLEFENDSLQKIIQFFSKISQDKLLINLIIKDSSQIQSQNNEIKNSDYQEKNIYLEKKVQVKQMINAIQQGVFGKVKIQVVDNRSNDQKLKDYLSDLNQFQNSNYYKEIQRNLNNFLCQQPITFESGSKQVIIQFDYIPYIDNNGILSFFELHFKQNKIVINNSTQVILNYHEKIIILFQSNQFMLYYCQIQCNCIQKNCQQLDLKKFQNFDDIKQKEHIKEPIIAYKKQKIYLNYGYLGDQIWEFNIINEQVNIKKRVKLNNFEYLFDAGEQQNLILERDGASVLYNLFDNKDRQHYFLLGGELGKNDSICNIVEKVEHENDNFSSGFVRKSSFDVSLKPFLHSLVLEGNQYAILLPNDFNNKRYKYSQIMNHEHYEYAQLLRVIKNKWIIEKIKIVYENQELGRIYPIHLMPIKQWNVISISQNYWIACFYNFQLQQMGSINQFFQYIEQDESNQNQFLYKDINQIKEGNLNQIIIKMDIKYIENKLRISINPVLISKNQSILKYTYQVQI